MSKIRLKKVIERTFNIEISRPKITTTIVNDAVNLEKKTIFIAIPKTGTTSIRSQMKQIGTPILPGLHLNIVQIKELFYVYLLNQTLDTNRSFPNESIPSDCELRVEAEEMFNSFFKFSAVRNPWARAVSLYHRREGVATNDKITFEEFCEAHSYASDTCRHPTRHKNQLDWLTSPDGNLLMNYVYKVEEFDKAIDEIKEMTNGRLKLDSIRRNVNPNSKSNDYRNMYNDKTRKIIEKRFEVDIDYFKYSF